jgi:tetraacyldisaccharide 4'-kinase
LTDRHEQARPRRTRPGSPLSAIYGGIARFRRSWYERHPAARRRLAKPVISVGNLVLGGSGKTPVVAALARILQAMGERPAILSRGYARRKPTRGVLVVSDGHDLLAGVDASGDEPQMLARTLSGVPVLVARERYLAGLVAENQFAATVHLLDDGYQHLRLARTVDLLLVSPVDLEEQLLPSGHLREPLSAAHAADALLVHGTSGQASQVAAVLEVATAFTVSTRYGPLERLGGGAADGARRVVGVAGIARPARFFTALRQQGFDVAVELPFRDHHWYETSDVARVIAAAHDAQADAIVTTAKDAVRLTPVVGAAVVGADLRPSLKPRPTTVAAGGGDQVRPTGAPWTVLPMDVTIEPAEAFATWLHARLAAHRGEAQA